MSLEIIDIIHDNELLLSIAEIIGNSEYDDGNFTVLLNKDSDKLGISFLLIKLSEILGYDPIFIPKSVEIGKCKYTFDTKISSSNNVFDFRDHSTRDINEAIHEINSICS